MHHLSMRSANAFAAALSSLLLLLPYLATAVTLKDFTPRIDPASLSSACAAVYSKDVDGCVASDFTSSGQCSQACVASLLSLNEQVFNTCSGSSQSNQGIIGAFLSGKGLTFLCPNSPTTVYVATSTVTASPSSPSANSPPPTVWPSPSSSDSTSSTVYSSSSIYRSSSPSATPTSTASTINIIDPSSTSSSASSSSTTTMQSSTSDTSTSTSSDSSNTFTTTSSTSSPTSVLTTSSSANSTTAAPTTTEGPYNPPPNLPSSGTGAIPTQISASPTGAAAHSAAQCVPSGGGGSLIGNHACASTAAWTVHVEKSWLSAAMVAWLGLVFQLYHTLG